MTVRRLGKIGVYGPKTRTLQRRISFEAFGLTYKIAEVYMYLGSRAETVPDIDDIQTKVFFEVPDRAYASQPISIPVGMEALPETKTDFSRFGLINPLQDETIFRFHVDDFEPLGRHMVIGDVFELPFFRNGGDVFWEVTDVDRRSEAEKFIVVVHATPLNSSRATREIPMNKSNDTLMDEIMGSFDTQVSGVVPAEGTYQVIPTPQEVDYRNELQSGFLDDPLKEI